MMRPSEYESIYEAESKRLKKSSQHSGSFPQVFPFVIVFFVFLSDKPSRTRKNLENIWYTPPIGCLATAGRKISPKTITLAVPTKPICQQATKQHQLFVVVNQKLRQVTNSTHFWSVFILIDKIIRLGKRAKFTLYVFDGAYQKFKFRRNTFFLTY